MVDRNTSGDSEAATGDDLDDLADALEGLSRIAMGGSLEVSLTRIAVLAVGAIPGADGVGLTMLEPGQAETVSVSSPFVREVDDIQYTLREGPCITAAAEGRVVMSGALGEDLSWPRFGPRVRALGVHSVISLPLVIDDDVLGALNVYAHGRDVFDERAAGLGLHFAASAAVAVHNARILMQARRLAVRLQAALTNRAVIDQAIGITRARQGGTSQEAFDRLRTLSQTSNQKLSVVATSIVEEAVSRSRARNTGP